MTEPLECPKCSSILVEENKNDLVCPTCKVIRAKIYRKGRDIPPPGFQRDAYGFWGENLEKEKP